MKNKSNFKRLDSKQYSVYEDHTSEIKKLVNSTLYAVSDSGELIFNSKRYYTLDENRLKCIISKGISCNTLGALIVLTQNLLQKFNICLDPNNKPFNAKSLSKQLKMTTQYSRHHIRELINHNILHEGVVKGKEDLKKVLILNPNLIRKGAFINGSLKGLFDDLCE